MFKNIFSILIIALLLLPSQFVLAQDGKVTDEIQVLSTFNAKLQASNKLSTTPTVPANNTSASSNLNYQLPTRLLTLKYEPPVIRPLSMKGEKPETVYQFFGKVGYGTPNSPFAELRYNSGRGDKLEYGAFFKHHSANNKKILNQQFSNTDVALNATKYLKGFGVGGNIGYTRDQYNFYGLNPMDTAIITSDTMRQVFNTVKVGAHFFNAQPTGAGINYRSNLDLYRTGGSYDEADFGVKFAGQISKAFGQNTALVKIYNDFNTFNQDTAGTNNNILGINPSYTVSGEAFSAKVGVNLGTESDSGFFVMPDLEATYSLADEKFVLLAGWTGAVQKNSFYSTIEQNPFVFAPLDLRNTRMQKFYAGVKVSLDGVQFKAVVAQKLVKNLQLYLNDTSAYRYFHTRYDDGSIFNVHGEVLVTAVKNLEVSGTIDLNAYTLDNELRAWHLPNVEGNISAAYRMLDDKLRLKAEIYLVNSIPYLTTSNTEGVLAGVFDLSFGANYAINNNFGVFLNVNNVTAQQYVRYYQSPNYGFNILGGLTVKF